MKKQDITFIMWLRTKLDTFGGESGNHKSTENDFIKLDKNVISKYATTLHVPEDEGQSVVWKTLSSRINDEKIIELPKRKYKKYLLAVAASVTILLGLMFVIAAIDKPSDKIIAYVFKVEAIGLCDALFEIQKCLIIDKPNAQYKITGSVEYSYKVTDN